ncbi:tRNA A-37 threonylcarbamoyl transferase component Bud32 [Rhodobacter sp. JA431]|nr:tRNA A-37 threonylcarbamoyl transferase component Bud32 [Rhodobacter sp. JA431]
MTLLGCGSGHATRERLREERKLCRCKVPIRIEKAAVNGVAGWRKRVEDGSLRLRLQKGDPRRLFEAERESYHQVARAGLPFPKLLEEGKSHFIVADAGVTLRHLARAGAAHAAEFETALIAAAETLARLHRAGFSHGRPNLCDICWADGQITFIDLENFSSKRNTPDGHARDLLIFFFDILAERGRVDEVVRAAARAYQAQDRMNIWGRAEARLDRLRPFVPALLWLTRPVAHKRDFRGIPGFVSLFDAKA